MDIANRDSLSCFQGFPQPGYVRADPRAGFVAKWGNTRDKGRLVVERNPMNKTYGVMLAPKRGSSITVNGASLFKKWFSEDELNHWVEENKQLILSILNE